jgi:CRP-like cAMP-binding protein
MQLPDHLQPLWPFSEMDSPLLTEIARFTRQRCHRSGDTLFHDGDSAHSLYLVVSGAVHLQRVLPDGEVCHLARFVPLDLVSDVALPNQEPRRADVVTAGPCEQLIVGGTPFTQGVEWGTRFAPRFMEGVFKGQSRRLQAQALFQTMNVVSRMVATLQEWGETYDTADPSGVRRLEASITRQEISHSVGARRESVNQILSSLLRLVTCAWMAGKS